MEWLDIHQGDAPLVLTLPHTGTDIPDEIARRLQSPWRARKDTDWWIEQLYDFAPPRGITTIRSRISRTVIDLNRDPCGASLYPGQATTELCPTTTFDGESLYLRGEEPDDEERERRTDEWFWPYHRAIEATLDRLLARHPRVILYDAHSIRSQIPRLFEGTLPHFNIGTNRGETCDSSLTESIARICRESRFETVVNGRFLGGWTVRHYGRAGRPVQAVQMELACRGYLAEPDYVTPENWPPPYEPERSAELRSILQTLFEHLL